MSNPYQPAKAALSTTRQPWRLAHSLAALVSGLAIPPLAIFLTARLLTPDVPLARSNSTFWGSVVLGSVLAAAAVHRHKRIPLWLAAAIGPVIVLVLVLAPVLWAAVLGTA
ncbi:hypothetical protein [Marilutibacter chinensis]|uniref:Uncharacterized protein n=1 Tax=Marilutibacter chinensis TaxID=2912247 RepID=A0ABS9HZ41_9GAMM|nr:hypothetical protein [Lysobacter chinensis]MCF7223414.1 hypothetical protein [Lysobacter chinensis]